MTGERPFHDRKGFLFALRRTESECFRPINGPREFGHLATSPPREPCDYRVDARSLGHFAPLIQYAMLLKCMGSR